MHWLLSWGKGWTWRSIMGKQFFFHYVFFTLAFFHYLFLFPNSHQFVICGETIFFSVINERLFGPPLCQFQGFKGFLYQMTLDKNLGTILLAINHLRGFDVFIDLAVSIVFRLWITRILKNAFRFICIGSNVHRFSPLLTSLH